MTNPDPTSPKGFASRAVEVVCRVFQWIPPKARLAVCSGSLVLIPLAIYTYMSNNHGDLNVVCRHNLRSAELSVTIDGKLAFSELSSGIVKKRFGFLDKKVEGSLSRSLSVPLGKHIVRVSLKSMPERFDQTRQIPVNLISGREATVTITSQRGDLSLAYQGAPIDQDKLSGPDSSGVSSLLVTMMGSVGSAAIGFLVQEFLRARKAAFLHKQSSG